MFERFADRARRVVVRARAGATAHNHNFIGTEHVLLGLIDGDGVGVRVLEWLGIGLEAVRRRVEEIIGRGDQPPSGNIPFTPQAKQVLELAPQEARSLMHG